MASAATEVFVESDSEEALGDGWSARALVPATTRAALLFVSGYYLSASAHDDVQAGV